MLGPVAGCHPGSPPSSRGSRGRIAASQASPAAASANLGGGIAASSAALSATPPGTAGGRQTPTGAEARGELCQTPTSLEQAMPSLEPRRSRLREGGAALLSSGRGHGRLQRGSNRASTGSSLASASSPAQGSHAARRGFNGARSAAGMSAESLEDSNSEVLSGAVSLNGGSRASMRDDDDAEDDIIDDDVDIRRERERERQLRARVRGLQRQLEGLQLATATLQAVVNHTGAPAEPAQSRGPRAPPDAASEIVSLQEARATRSLQQEGAAGRSRPTRGSAGSAAVFHVQPSEAADTDENEDVEFHAHVTCDGCGMGPPLYGEVMKCTECADFDFCARCYRDRDRLGHPRSHRFVPRSSSVHRGSVPSMSGAGHLGPLLSHGRGQMAGVLLHLLEAEMLYEALRQSAAADGIEEETPEDKELRSAEVLSTLPRIGWHPPSEKDEDGHAHNCEECALCLEEYVRGEEVLKLPCRHLFHEGCLGPWFTRSLTCPLCKQEVAPAQQ